MADWILTDPTGSGHRSVLTASFYDDSFCRAGIQVEALDLRRKNAQGAKVQWWTHLPKWLGFKRVSSVNEAVRRLKEKSGIEVPTEIVEKLTAREQALGLLAPAPAPGDFAASPHHFAEGLARVCPICQAPANLRCKGPAQLGHENARYVFGSEWMHMRRMFPGAPSTLPSEP